MKKIIVNGRRRLQGNIDVSGSKNASLPVIFACILTKGVSRIENLPNIGDTSVALDILSSLGAVIRRDKGVTFIDTTALRYTDPDASSVEKIRASTYLIGSLLARFGRCPIMRFGGCNFSLRPIDMHIDAAISFGARLEDNSLISDNLRANEIVFSRPSVGATVNALLLASTIDGDSIIRGCAVEPHIDLLVDFLNSCGAGITRIGRDMYVRGGELHGGNIRIIPDMIEAGSYLALSLMLNGQITVCECPVEDMDAVLSAFNSLGAEIRRTGENKLSARIKEYKPVSLIATPYPGFPTDLQPIFAPIMAIFGGGDITDIVWETRFGYLKTLSCFGIKSFVEENRAFIYPSTLHRAIATAPDLRGGMAALMCAIYSEGQSEILSAEIILRGYEDIVKKLCAIGAEIKIEDF